MITVSGVSKRFKKKIAVDDVSFTVESGKVTGFLGPNGAGKSTTMRIMAGLDHGQGSVSYDDRQLGEYLERSRIIGILLEAKAYHPTRSARNHLRILAAQGNIPESRVDEVLDTVGLQEVGKKQPGKFSLGMSQRLGIAAAILGKPKHLILDEPANGLDPEGIAWLRQFIKDYAHDGNTVFVSSHLLSEMALMADNVVVIGRGKLIANTTVSQLISQGGHTDAIVRTTQTKKLSEVLTQSKIEFTVDESKVVIPGKTSDEIGKIAFRANIPLLELSNRSASLEEVFLQLTEKSEEFRPSTKGKEVAR